MTFSLDPVVTVGQNPSGSLAISNSGLVAWTSNGTVYCNSVSVGQGSNPIIDSTGQTVWIAWINNGQIMLSKSGDGGLTFGSPVNIGFGSSPQLSAGFIAFIDSNNGIAFWNGSKVISIPSGSCIQPSLSVSGSNVYIAWIDASAPKREVRAAISTDGGITFSILNVTATMPTNTHGGVGSANPKIYASGFIVFDDTVGPNGLRNIFMSKIANGAATLPVNISNYGGMAVQPVLAADSGIIHVAFLATNNYGASDTAYIRSTDGGATWNNGPFLTRLVYDTASTNGTGPCYNVAIVASGLNVYVAFLYKFSNVNGDVVLSYSADGGKTFSQVNVSATVAIDSENFSFAALAQNGALVGYYAWIEAGKSVLSRKSTLGTVILPPPDTTAPTITINTPALGTRFDAGAAFTISGSASDTGGSGLKQVQISIDSGTAINATGTTTWTASLVVPISGTLHTITATATDNAGNSSSATLHLNQVPVYAVSS